MDLSIIVVSWRVREKLRANLRALSAAVSGLSCEIFVVDNNSQDGTTQMVAEEFSQVCLIANNDNLGFAKANNLALARARGDFVLLLNPDMLVYPDTLKNLVNWLRANPRAWAAGGRLVDESGRLISNVRRFPRFGDQLAVALKLPHIWPGILNKYLRRDFDYDRPAKVDSVRGSFLAIARATLEKVGFLDERFFLWFEEVDYCRRVYEAGGEVWYTPAATCVDYVGQSFQQRSRVDNQKIMRDSQLKYFAKWQPAWQAAILRIAWAIGRLIVAAGLLFKIKIRNQT